MEPITFDNTSYWIGDRPVYLNAGEFHYFRVPKNHWRPRMEHFKAAGGMCLSTYIPWAIHEPTEGTFVFDAGDGTTDLRAFLELAAELDLYVIARPGPYQYSELIYGGLPGWLFERYPDVRARTIDGTPFGHLSVSYVHPVYLEKAKRWLAAVAERLSPYTVSRGGPIAFTQIDNELTGVHIWFGSLDYHPESMGFGRPDGRYPRYLARRYGDISRLNAAYQTQYSDFATVRPLKPLEAQPGYIPHVRRLRDYFEYYLSTVAEYMEITAQTLRQHGVDTPFIHNAANPGMNVYFYDVPESLGSDFLLGSDHYYNLDQDWPQNHPTPQYARDILMSMEMLRMMGYPPTVLELPSGSASDWPPFTPEDAAACYMTNLAFGMKGHNYYIFTGGPNPPRLGDTTDLYDFGAPIGAWGEIRPLYHTQKAFAEFIHGHEWLVRGQRLWDVRLGFSFQDARAERYWLGRGGLLFTPADAYTFLQKGLLTSALCAGLNPVMVNLDHDDWVHDIDTPLVVATSVSMPRAQQQRLIRFVQRGGRLLLAPLLPSLDEDLYPCRELADFLGAPDAQRPPGTVTRITIQNDDSPIVNIQHNDAFIFNPLPEGAEALGWEEWSQQPIAWQRSWDSGGTVIVLGVHWRHKMHEQSDALTTLLSQLHLSRLVSHTNPNVWVSVWANEEKTLVFLLNLFTSPMCTRLQCRTRQGAWVDLGEHCIPPMTVSTVELSQ